MARRRAQGNARANMYRSFSRTKNQNMHQSFVRNKLEKDHGKLKWSRELKAWICSICQMKISTQISCMKHNQKYCTVRNPSWDRAWDESTMGCRYCGQTGFETMEMIRGHIKGKNCPDCPDFINKDKVQGETPHPRPVREMPVDGSLEGELGPESLMEDLLELVPGTDDLLEGELGPESNLLPVKEEKKEKHSNKRVDSSDKRNEKDTRENAPQTPDDLGRANKVREHSKKTDKKINETFQRRDNKPPWKEPQQRATAQKRKTRVMEPVIRKLKAPASGPRFPKLARNLRQFPGPSSFQEQLSSRFEAPKAQIRPVRQADSRPLQKPGVMRTDVDAPGREPGFEKFSQTSGQPRLSAAQSGAEDWPLNSPPRAWPSTLQQQQASRGRPESWAEGAVGGPEGTWSDSAHHTSHTASWQTWPGNERDRHGNERDRPGNDRDYPGNERDYPGNDRDHPKILSERSAGYYGESSGPERFNERWSGPERFNERSAEQYEGRSGPERFNERFAESREAEQYENRSLLARYEDQARFFLNTQPDQDRRVTSDRDSGRTGGFRSDWHVNQSASDHGRYHSPQEEESRFTSDRLADHERSDRLTTERFHDFEQPDRFTSARLADHERSDKLTVQRSHDLAMLDRLALRKQLSESRYWEGGWKRNDDDNIRRQGHYGDNYRDRSPVRSKETVSGRGSDGLSRYPEKETVSGRGSDGLSRYPEKGARDPYYAVPVVSGMEQLPPDIEEINLIRAKIGLPPLNYGSLGGAGDPAGRYDSGHQGYPQSGRGDGRHQRH